MATRKKMRVQLAKKIRISTGMSFIDAQRCAKIFFSEKAEMSFTENDYISSLKSIGVKFHTTKYWGKAWYGNSILHKILLAGPKGIFEFKGFDYSDLY